ncbi:Nodulation protein D 2 [compost metagenome]
MIAANTGHGEADALMTRQGIQRSIRLEVPHFAAIGHILQHTDLLATVPEHFASFCREPFGLTALSHPVALPEFTVNVLWHGRYHRDPANSWLRKLIFKVLSEV